MALTLQTFDCIRILIVDLLLCLETSCQKAYRKNKKNKNRIIRRKEKIIGLIEGALCSTGLPAPSNLTTIRTIDLGFQLFPRNLVKQKGMKNENPTSEEIRCALELVNNPDQFDLYNHGHILALENGTKKIIADVHFTDLTQIEAEQRLDLDFLCEFLHQSKEFVNTVKSKGRSCGGSMWALGWRKSYTQFEIMGTYRNINAIKSNPIGYQKHLQEIKKIAHILWKLFIKIGNVALEKNQEFMGLHNIPSFGDSDYLDQSSDYTKKIFASNLTFTSDGFYNLPHKDRRDESELPFAFLLILPIFRSTGKLALASDGYDVSGGQFVFPQCKFGLEFGPNMMCQAIFSQKDYEHATLRPIESLIFTKLGISMQISSAMTRTSDYFTQGFYDDNPEYFISDSKNVLNHSLL